MSDCSIIQVGFNEYSTWVSGGRRQYFHVVQEKVNLTEETVQCIVYCLKCNNTVT